MNQETTGEAVQRLARELAETKAKLERIRKKSRSQRTALRQLHKAHVATLHEKEALARKVVLQVAGIPLATPSEALQEVECRLALLGGNAN